MTGAGVLTFNAAPDFEAARNTYTLVIEVRDSKDGAGKADTDWDDAVTLTVNVTDVAEPPDAPADLAVSSTANGLTVTWTAPVMTGKPPLTGYDVEQRLRTSAAGAVTPVWGAWTDASHTGTAASASITGLTPEATYQVRVRAVNAEGNGEWAGPEEGVPGHPNRAPTFDDGETASVNAAENQTAVATPDVTDLDGDDLTYRLDTAAMVSAPATNDHALFTMTGAGVLTFKAAPDFEAAKNTYTLVIEVRDSKDVNGDGDTDWDDSIILTINVNDLNEAPSFDDGASASVNAAENQTAVATPEVTDPEKDDLTYRLDTAAAFTDPGVSNDHASFTMTGAGVLTFNAAPDFEAARNTYTLVIEVRDSKDGAGKADTDWDDAVTLTVNVTDVAEPPDAPADLAVSSTANGLTVTWTAPVMTGKPPLTGYDVEQRLRTSAAGAVTPVWGAWTDASHTGTAASSSITGLTPEAVYQVRVRAVNDEGESGWTSASGVPGHPNRAPAFPSGSVTLDVDENTASGADIDDSPAATDLDGDSLTYSLGGTGSAHFAIVAGSGQLQTKGALDHEKKASYSVVVTASDGTLTDTIAVTIEVNDLNEAPSFDDGASASVNAAENQTAVATPEVTDPEKDDLTYRLDTAAAFTDPGVSNDHASFTMTGAGVLTFNAAPDFEAARNTYTLVIEVRDSKDGAGKADTDWDDAVTLTVNVTDVAEPPDAPADLAVSSTANGLTVTWTAPVMTGEAAADGLRRGAAAAHQRRRRRHPGLGGVDRRVPHRHGGQRQHHRADAGGGLPGAGAGGQRRGERGVGRAGGRGAGPPQPGAGLPQRQRDAGRGREHGTGRRHRRLAGGHGPGRGLPDLLAGRDRLGPLRHRGRQRPAADQGGAGPREEGQLLGGGHRQRRDADGHHRGDHRGQRPERGAQLRRRGDRVGQRGGEPDGGGHAGRDRPGWGRSHLPAGHGGGLQRSRGLQRPRVVHHDRRRSPDLQRGPGLRGGQEHLHPGHRGAGQQGRRGQGRHGLGRRRHPDGQRHRRGRAAGRARRSGGEFHGQRADGDLDGAGDDGEAAADGLRRGAAAAHQRRRRRHPGLGGVDRRVPHRHGGQRQHHRADAGGDLPGAGAGGQRRGERGVGRAGGRGAGAAQPGPDLRRRGDRVGERSGEPDGGGHAGRHRLGRGRSHLPAGHRRDGIRSGHQRPRVVHHDRRRRPDLQGGAGLRGRQEHLHPGDRGAGQQGRERRRRHGLGRLHHPHHQRDGPERGAQLRRRRQRVGERGGEPDGGGHAGRDRPGWGRSHLPAGHRRGGDPAGDQRPRVVHHDRRRSPDLQRGPGLRGGQEHLHPGHRGKGQQGRRGQGRHGLGRRRHPDGQRHRRGRAAGRARRSGGEFHGQRADGDLDGAGDDGEAAADGLRRGAAAAHQRRRRRHPGLGGRGPTRPTPARRPAPASPG